MAFVKSFLTYNCSRRAAIKASKRFHGEVFGMICSNVGVSIKRSTWCNKTSNSSETNKHAAFRLDEDKKTNLVKCDLVTGVSCVNRCNIDLYYKRESWYGGFSSQHCVLIRGNLMTRNFRNDDATCVFRFRSKQSQKYFY